MVKGTPGCGDSGQAAEAPHHREMAAGVTFYEPES